MYTHGKMGYKTVVSLTLLLFNVCLSNSLIRNDVNIVGVTLSPVYHRPYGHFMEKCPDTYPYLFDNGKKCCRSAMKETDPVLSPDCDGTRILYGSHEKCCFKQMYVECGDQNIGCNYAKVTCQPKPTIVFADPAWNNDEYKVANILTYQRCEDTADGSYFITKDGKLNHIIIIDFGCEVAIKKFLLRNVRHRGTRNTKDFTIESSYDMSNWNMVLSDNLQKPSSVCDFPIEEFETAAHGRYIRSETTGEKQTSLLFLDYTL